MTFRNPILQLVLAVLVLLFIAELRSALPEFRALTKPVPVSHWTTTPTLRQTENSEFETAPLGPRGQPQFECAAGDIKLLPDSRYRIHFLVSDVHTSGPLQLTVDFYGPGYDSSRQEKSITIDKTPFPLPVTVSFESEKCPSKAQLRVFSMTNGSIRFTQPVIERFSRTYRMVDFLLFMSLLASGAMALYLFYRISRSAGTALVIVCALNGVLAFITPLPGADAHWNVPSVLSLMSHGTMELSQFRRELAESDGFGLVPGVNGIYNWYPAGMPVLLLPFVALGNLFCAGDLA